VVQILVKAGAKFLLNENGNSPLQWCIQNKAVAVVSFLLANISTIDVLKTNKFGKSCLSEAFNADNIEILNLVLSHPSAKGLEDQYAGDAAAPASDAGTVGAAAAESAPQGKGDAGDDGEDAEEASVHPKDSKITQSLVHQFSFDGSELDPLVVREVVTDWTGPVFDSDSSRDTTGSWARSANVQARTSGPLAFSSASTSTPFATALRTSMLSSLVLGVVSPVSPLHDMGRRRGFVASPYAHLKVLLTDFFQLAVSNLKYNAQMFDNVF
jgi:hypothetical protein